MNFITSSFVAFFLFTFSMNVFSQTSEIDSLLIVLESTNDPKEEVDILNTLAEKQVGKNDSLVLKYASEAISRSKKVDYYFGLGSGYRNIGQISLYKGDYKEARESYLVAKDYYEKSKNKEKIAAVTNDVGMTSSYLGEYEKSLNYFHKALLINEEIRDTAGITTNYTGIAAIFNRQEKILESIVYIKKATHLDSLSKQWNYFVQDLGNIATSYKKIGDYDEALVFAIRGYTFANEIKSNFGIYINSQVVGDVYRLLEDYDSSIEYLNESLRSAKDAGRADMIGNAFTALGLTYHDMDAPLKVLSTLDSALAYSTPINKPDILNNIGELYESNLNNLDSALYYNQKSIQAALDVSDSVKMVMPLLNIGFVQNRKGHLDKALISIKKALKIKEDVGFSSRMEESSLLKRVAEIFYASKDYDRAYNLIYDAVTLQDSLMEIEKSSQKQLLTYEKDIRQLQIRAQKFELNKKERKLKERLYIVLSLACLALITFIFVFILYSRNKKLKDANSKLEYLSNELDHRVKNDFQSIASMLFVQQNETQDVKAKKILFGVRDRILAMGQIHMLFYKKGNYFKMGLAKYLEKLVDNRTSILANNYLQAKVVVDIDMDENIDQKISFDEAKRLGIIINELITNVYKHAFQDHKSPAVTFKAFSGIRGADLIIQVIDNGVGIEIDAMSKCENSFGLKMINMNCEQLGWNFEFENMAKEGGTKFTVSINTED